MEFGDLVAVFTDELVMAVLFFGAGCFLAFDVALAFFYKLDQVVFFQDFDDSVNCRGVDFDFLTFGQLGNLVGI